MSGDLKWLDDNKQVRTMISYLQQENAVLHERVRKLENDAQEFERMLAAERREKWQWEHKAKERWALRRELEETLGLADRETYDEEKFKAAVKRISGLQAALSSEREACAKVAEEYWRRPSYQAFTDPQRVTLHIASLIRGREK